MLTPSIQETTAIKSGTKTYMIDFENKRISGRIDGFEAVRQWIRKCLMTEKDAYSIYPAYGCGLENLIGQDFLYASSMAKRAVTEALTADSRIVSVDDFEFEQDKDSFHMTFTVNTIYGGILEGVNV